MKIKLFFFFFFGNLDCFVSALGTKKIICPIFFFFFFKETEEHPLKILKLFANYYE